MELDFFQAVRRDGAKAVDAINQLNNINLTNEAGENLLHAAIAYKNEAIVGELIRRGIDVNAQDLKGQTPLHFAAAHEQLKSAEQILQNGGDLSIIDCHGNTPMWRAVFGVKGRYYEMVELFVNHGGLAVVSIKNKHGKSPLDFALQVKDERLLRIIGV